MRKPTLAFTLIELLIVVAIIGILAAIAIPNFRNARIRAQVARSQSNERTLRDAFMQYGLDNGNLPRHSDELSAHDRLTSPIAYINNRLPDVFKEGLVQRGMAVPHSGLYHAEPESEIRYNMGPVENFPLLYKAYRSGHSLVLLGYGPAQKYDILEYNSSNGIESRGGILTPIPKFSSKDGATY